MVAGLFKGNILVLFDSTDCSEAGSVYVIGVDEAGYGPNLGPLLIGASVWRIPSRYELGQLSARLMPEFQPRRWHHRSVELYVPLGDSKELYQSGTSTDSLQIGIFSLLNSTSMENSSHASSAASFYSRIGVEKILYQDKTSLLPWYLELDDCSALEKEVVNRGFPRIADAGLQRADVTFQGFSARVIHELEFNRLLDLHQSKGRLLSLATLELVRDVLSDLPLSQGDRVVICCDRHGGRQKYLEVLNEIFPDCFFWIDREQPSESSYRAEYRNHPLKISFTVGGDSQPATAAASMLAKLLRELCMDAFNQYWSRHVPGLVPTAGYPVDAKRFIAQLKESKIWDSKQEADVPRQEDIWRRA